MQQTARILVVTDCEGDTQALGIFASDANARQAAREDFSQVLRHLDLPTESLPDFQSGDHGGLFAWGHAGDLYKIFEVDFPDELRSA